MECVAGGEQPGGLARSARRRRPNGHPFAGSIGFESWEARIMQRAFVNIVTERVVVS